MHHSARLSWLLGATLLCGAGVALAQQTPDTVSALRQALKAPAHDPAARDHAIQQALEGLSGLGELRRALVLQEWRDEDIDPQVAAIDRLHRAATQQRFEKAVREVCSHGDATSQVAVADLLADVGITVRGVGTQDSLGRVFSADLARLATQGTPPVREAAAHALGQIHPELTVAVPALASLLAAPTPAERQAAAGALAGMMQLAGQIASRARSSTGVAGSRADVAAVAEAVLPLAGRALSDPEASVRRRGMHVIGWAATAASSLLLEFFDNGPEPAIGGRPPEDAHSELQPLLLALKEQAPVLAQALSDADGQVRALTRRTLEIIADLRIRWKQGATGGDDPLSCVFQAAAPALAECVADPDFHARRSAITVLEMVGPDAAPVAGALAKALNDPDRFVRWAAARALGKLAPGAAAVAVPGLISLLSDADLDLGLAAASSLKQYGLAALPAAPALAESARAGKALDLRLEAIRVLEHIGPAAAPAALPVLTVALGDADPHVRLAAAVALGKFGPAAHDAVEALSRARDDANLEVQEAAAEALLRIATAEK
jgi:HEAT repeat protein